MILIGSCLTEVAGNGDRKCELTEAPHLELAEYSVPSPHDTHAVETPLRLENSSSTKTILFASFLCKYSFFKSEKWNLFL